MSPKKGLVNVPPPPKEHMNVTQKRLLNVPQKGKTECPPKKEHMNVPQKGIVECPSKRDC